MSYETGLSNSNDILNLNLGWSLIYTDGDEEAVLVEDVTIEVIIGNENKRLSSDKVGIVHVMKSHNFCDIRSNKAKVTILAYANIII